MSDAATPLILLLLVVTWLRCRRIEARLDELSVVERRGGDK